MADEVVGYEGKVEIAPDSTGTAGSYAVLNGVTSFRESFAADELEKSYYGGGIARKYKAGMVKGTATLQINYIPADTAQGTLLAAIKGGLPVWLRWSPENTAGEPRYTVQCIATSLDRGANFDALSDIPVSLTFNGAPTEDDVPS